MEKLDQTLRTVVENMTRSTANHARRECPDCGRIVEAVKVDLPWSPTPRAIPGTCECVIECEIEAEKARRAAERRREIERRFALSELGPRFAESTFENWVDRPGSEEAWRAARDLIEDFPQRLHTGQGLLLHGPPGNGKSHLAAAVVQELIPLGYTCIFQDVPMLLLRFRSTFGPEAREREEELFRTLREADLIVLDDVGAEKWSEWRREVIYSIINMRYYDRRPLVATTNLGLDELEGRLGLRTLDRLVEMCEFVENAAGSYRMELARRGRS